MRSRSRNGIMTIVIAGVIALHGCDRREPVANVPLQPAPRVTSEPQQSSAPAGSTLATVRTPASDQKVEAWPRGPALGADERAAKTERLAAERAGLRTNWMPPERSEIYGHAEILIDASSEAVRSRIVDFGRYRDLAGPRFKKVNVVDSSSAGTDIYFQLPIMKGALTIWYVTRFAVHPMREADGAHVVEGTFVRGNVRDVHFVFTAMPSTRPGATILTCDLLLSLNFVAPQPAIDEALRNACGDAVSSVRAQLASTDTPAARP